jgi:hypothetical protein
VVYSHTKITKWILDGLGMEKVGIFYCYLVPFTTIWYILWPFGIFWYIFYCFGMLYQAKSGNPVEQEVSNTYQHIGKKTNR